MALDQPKDRANVLPLHENVRVIVPESAAAEPSAEPASTASTREPSAESVAAVFALTEIPLGSPLAATVQAAREVPTYPANGMVIVLAAEVDPAEVQGIDCESLPHTTVVADAPAAPCAPVAPLNAMAKLNSLTIVTSPMCTGIRTTPPEVTLPLTATVSVGEVLSESIVTVTPAGLDTSDSTTLAGTCSAPRIATICVVTLPASAALVDPGNVWDSLVMTTP